MKNIINDKIKKLQLSNVKIKLFSKGDNSNHISRIFSALKLANVACFEWNIKTNEIYVTDLFYVYCDFIVTNGNEFKDLLSSFSNESAFISFLDIIEKKLLNPNEVTESELEVYSKKKKKIIRVTTNLENDIILGVVHDITNEKKIQKEVNDSNEMIKQTLDAIPLPIICFDENNKLTFANTSLTEIYKIDWEVGELQKSIFTKLESKYESFKTKLIFEYGKHKRLETHAISGDGPLHTFIDRVSVNFEEKYIGKVYIITDVTELVQNELETKRLLKVNKLSIEVNEMIEEIEDSNELYQLILDKLLTVVIDAKRGCILKIDQDNNMYIASQVGYNNEYANSFKIPYNNSFADFNLGSNHNKAIIINDIQKNYSQMFPEVGNADRGFILESNITAPITLDGEIYAIISIDSDEPNAFDKIDLSLINYLKIQLERTISHHKVFVNIMQSSRRDALTGTYNRMYLEDMFSKYMQEADWCKRGFCFVVFDIDNLKNVNDSHGHLAGDKIITEFSKIIESRIRGRDIFARYGGDEFVGIFFDASRESMYEKILIWKDKLKNSKIEYNKINLLCDFSFGIGVYPDDGSTFDDLMDIADKRMYIDKNTKKSL